MWGVGALNKYFHKVSITGIPPMGNRHQHWRKTSNERKLWHSKIIRAFQLKPKTPIEKCIIRVCRFSNRQPDFDNLVWSFKSTFDGLIHAKIIKDDNMNVVIDRKYSWCKVQRIMSHITVEVEEI